MLICKKNKNKKKTFPNNSQPVVWISDIRVKASDSQNAHSPTTDLIIAFSLNIFKYLSFARLKQEFGQIWQNKDISLSWGKAQK